MTHSKNLSDYKNHEMLEIYNQLVNSYDEPSARTRYHTFYSNLPSLKEKTVLDIPCGIGCKSRNVILKYGADKVLALDIVREQIQYSRQKDGSAGIKDGQIEYIVHDCKIPSKVGDQLADIGMCVHLFCFAKSYQEVLDLAKCIYLNLKRGSECYILICSLSKDPEAYQKLELFDLEIVNIDPWVNINSEPRQFHTRYQGFNYDCWLWEYQTLCTALKETGFTEVEMLPYIADPSYRGKLDLELYIELLDGYILKAVKS